MLTMKRSIIIIVIALLSYSVHSQKRNEFTGPAYKNYKPWKYDFKPEIVYSVDKRENLTGPEFKNRKAWDKSNEIEYTPIAFGSERSKLMGPAYKNYKPWRKNKKDSTKKK